MEQNTLTHHGIKGQRWGVRRFQTKSGSLTAAGKKRYGKDDDSKTNNVEEKSKNKSSSNVHDDYKKVRAKSIKEMSDEELRDAVNRLNMEKRYSELNPKPESAGKKFVKSFVLPNAKWAAETYLKKAVNAKLDEMFKKEADKKTDNKTADNTKTDTKPGTDGTNKENTSSSTSKSDNTNGGAHGIKGEKWGKRSKSTEKDDTVYEGEVSGEGTSKRSNKDTKSHSSDSAKRTIYDVEWEDVSDTPTSSTGSSFVSKLGSGASTVADTAQVFSGMFSKMSQYTPQISSGQNFVAGLLEPPKN